MEKYLTGVGGGTSTIGKWFSTHSAFNSYNTLLTMRQAFITINRSTINVCKKQTTPMRDGGVVCRVRYVFGVFVFVERDLQCKEYTLRLYYATTATWSARGGSLMSSTIKFFMVRNRTFVPAMYLL